MTLRVLLVEDEPDIRLIAQAALLREGLDVITAATGAEALQLVAREKPDVVLLDWMLPDVDGFETWSRLQANPATAHLPVIFLTARNSAADQLKCLEAGALGCIAKPFNPLALGAQVKTLWRCRGGAPQLQP
jgi:two-component system cell cycle response regulator